MRVIVENTSAKLLLVEGFDIESTWLKIDSETVECVRWIEFKGLEDLRLFVKRVGSALCTIYENEKRWGEHWPEELRCMFMEVDDSPAKRVSITITERED